MRILFQFEVWNSSFRFFYVALVDFWSRFATGAAVAAVSESKDKNFVFFFTKFLGNSSLSESDSKAFDLGTDLPRRWML